MAIAISPASESEIRYAVMRASPSKINMRHDRFAIISGANPIPACAIRMADRRKGAAADVNWPRPRAGAFARAG
jgi:hypothetical protein